MKRFTIGAAAALLLSACSMGQDVESPDAALDLPDVADGTLSEETMKRVTERLSSDEFEGRAPGTAGEEKTIAYLIEEFGKAGLEPGNNGSWVQDVPLVEITGKDFAPLTISGGDNGDIKLNYATDWVGATYREDVETKLDDSELVFVGYGINAPEKGWNDYEGLDMKGKTAVILVNDPDFGAETLDGPFNGKAMTYYGRWTYKYEEAGRQGAAAAIIIHDTEPAAYGWNVVESSWSGPQAYADRGDNPPPMTKLNGWVQKEKAREILAAAGQDLDDLMAAARKDDFKAVPLGLKASTSFRNDIRTFASKNVIGILPGSERPDEYVMHTAHWDHLGRCTPAPDGDDICNGAVDNATKRSLVFLAVTAEESGLLGADYYAANPVFPLNKTVGGINMDAFLVAGPAKDVTVVGPGKSQLDLFLDKALMSDDRVTTPNPNPEAGYYYRSDHFAFAKRGVPMLYLDGGEDLVDGGKEAGAAVQADYRDNRYHGPKDEYDPNWDWSGVMADLRLFYRIGRMLGDSTSWPNWVEGDEFKATRDEDCAVDGALCGTPEAP